MTPAERNGVIKAAKILAKALPIETTADVLNGLLCVDADESLEDWECKYANLVFDVMANENPEAVIKARQK